MNPTRSFIAPVLDGRGNGGPSMVVVVAYTGGIFPRKASGGVDVGRPVRMLPSRMFVSTMPEGRPFSVLPGGRFVVLTPISCIIDTGVSVMVLFTSACVIIA